MKTGNGKIANLPPKLRDELNLRISHGDEGVELVEWLNAKPEVAEVVNKLFDGTPISEQNLSEWRKRGYQKWLAHRNSVDESNAVHDNSADIAATGIDPDKLLLTLTGAYADMTRNWMITPGADMLYKLSVYKKLTDGVIALQRAELQKVRLLIARERLELLREKRCNKSASSSGRCETASSPQSAPDSNQGPATSEPSPKVAPPAPPDGPPIPQNIAPPNPVPAPPAPAPAPQRHPGGEQPYRRPDVAPKTKAGLPLPTPTMRPAPCAAPGYATQTNSYNPLAAPKPSAPKVIPSRPTPIR